MLWLFADLYAAWWRAWLAPFERQAEFVTTMRKEAVQHSQGPVPNHKTPAAVGMIVGGRRSAELIDIRAWRERGGR